MQDREETGRNRLAGETSPYLLQHATNPVDWYPWGPEALERARGDERPIFLSIGYSACHWCHVMERESFTDPTIARFLNEHFVCVKVDREERPDLDEIYMKAVISLSGTGGWPLTVFLTPELEPFAGGTYFPPYPLRGMPGFTDLVSRIARTWRERPEGARSQGRRLSEQIAREGRVDSRAPLPPDVLDRSLASLQQAFDPVHGGFGDAPKFPHAVDLRLLLRHALRTGRPEPLHMAAASLAAMARGGIHDQLGGGFARYSTDEEWLVPHFEKMLYDNALLVPAYLEAHLATGRPDFAEVASGVCEWALGEMRTPEGAFASSLDADSEGEEGRYYVWTPGELREVLGARRGELAAEWYGVTPEGSFEQGASVLTRTAPVVELAGRCGLTPAELTREMAEARRLLLEHRSRRVPPARDDKVLPAWNALMIGALAQAAQVLEEPRYAEAAGEAARFLLERMRRPDGRLHASYRAGRAHLDGGLDDHAFLVQALIDLYETDFDERWLRAALALDEHLREHFEDAEQGGLFTTPDDGEPLIARLKSHHDGALPAGSGVQALNLLRLCELTGRVELAQRAERLITSLGALVSRYPQAFGQLLLAVDFLQAPPREVVLAGEPGTRALGELLRAVRRSARPQRVVALARTGADTGLLPLLRERDAPAGSARAYVCLQYACREPVEGPAALRELLEGGEKGDPSTGGPAGTAG